MSVDMMATVRAGPAYWRVHVFGTKGWAEALGETRLTVAPIGQEPQTRTLLATDSLATLLDQFAAAVEGGPARVLGAMVRRLIDAST